MDLDIPSELSFKARPADNILRKAEAHRRFLHAARTVRPNFSQMTGVSLSPHVHTPAQVLVRLRADRRLAYFKTQGQDAVINPPAPPSPPGLPVMDITITNLRPTFPMGGTPELKLDAYGGDSPGVEDHEAWGDVPVPALQSGLLELEVRHVMTGQQSIDADMRVGRYRRHTSCCSTVR